MDKKNVVQQARETEVIPQKAMNKFKAPIVIKDSPNDPAAMAQAIDELKKFNLEPGRTQHK